jgi:TonB-linked SusC/RagA family outer membrane protein
MTKKISAIFLIMLFVASIQAQTVRITGKVTNANDGEPIIGASVVVKDQPGVGTSTNIDGGFTLNVPIDAKFLVVSYLGMKTAEVQIISGSPLDISLAENVSEIDEVIVVAYGTAKKSSFTGSAAQVKAEKFESRPMTNVTSALAGTTSGVQVSTTNGQPGSEPNIYIRGIGTINSSVSSAPLIILNGMPYDNAISSINPGDIESLTVLKDASSSALYGARAANGVILITTKTGKKDKMSVNVKFNQGFTARQTNDYEKVSVEDYLHVYWESTRNQLLKGKTNPTAAEIAEAGQTAAKNVITNNLMYNPYNVPDDQVLDANGWLNPNAQFMWADDTDWTNAIQQLGKRTDASVNLGGGNSKSDYYASIGYLTEEGYIIGSKFERYTMQANVNSQITNFLKVGATVSGNLSKSIGEQTESSGGNSNPFRFTRYIGPIYPIHLHNPITKDYVRDTDGNPIYDFGTGYASDEYTMPTRNYIGGNNPAIELQNLFSGYKRNTLNAKAYAEIRFLDGFKFTANASVGANAYLGSSATIIYPEKGNTGSASRSNSFTTTWNYNQLLSYTKDFDRHHIEALLGHESYSYEYNYLSGSMSDQKVADNNYELVNYSTPGTPTSYTNTYRTEGYLSRLNYDYDNRYFISGSVRRDASSRFYKDSRWGTFYSVGAGWRVDQEAFMKTLSFVDLLKLRVSYGEVGNDAIGTYYAWQATYMDLKGNGLEAAYIRDRVLNSRTLQWETSHSSDVALEFDLFKSRISGSVEYFNRQSSNLLFNVPQSPSSGLTTALQNAGTMYNRGVEVDLNGVIVKTKDFSWNLGINATYLKNKITSLPIDPYSDAPHRIEEGHSRYEFYLRQWAGVDPETGNSIYVPTEEVLTAYNEATEEARAAMSIVTVDGQLYTTKVAEALYDWSGVSTPKVAGGITSGFSWKGLTLSLLFNYQLGGKYYDTGYGDLMTGPSGSALLGSTRHVDIMNRWTEKGQRTDVPRLDDFTDTNLNAGTSTRWLISSDMLELTNATLNYDLPKSITKRFDVQGIRVYFSGDNLLLFTHRQGMYPRKNIFSGYGGNPDVYLPSRVFTLGLNLTF